MTLKFEIKLLNLLTLAICLVKVSGEDAAPSLLENVEPFGKEYRLHITLPEGTPSNISEIPVVLYADNKREEKGQVVNNRS